MIIIKLLKNEEQRRDLYMYIFMRKLYQEGK